MTNQRERDLLPYRMDSPNGDDFDESSSVDSASSFGVGSSANSNISAENGDSTSEVRLTERLMDILVGEGDGDLLIQQTNREDRLLQWLQALDMQVMGACRADERLKPFLKMNSACGVAEDPLLTQLSQHFEPSEVGMLARCFCVPLLSIRVGKINKEGTRLCPTANRRGNWEYSIMISELRGSKVYVGNLSLVLLPSSDIRLSFIGDDSKVERLFTLTSKSQCAAVVIDEIPTDSSGRSFLVGTPDSRTFYFWCSEKSKLLGIELLAKMKDLLQQKPSIAELSGISNSRLDCFATQLGAFLVGSSLGSSLENSVCASTFASENSQSSSSKFPRSRHSGGQVTKGDTALYQSILSPRSSSFKEVPPRNLSSHRIAAREKIKRRGDSHQFAFDNPANESTNNLDLSITSDHDEVSEVPKTFAFSSCFLGSLGKLAVSSSLGLGGDVAPVVSPLFTPNYCWCPPGISTFPSLTSLPQVSNSSVDLTSPYSGASLLPSTLPVSLLQPIQPLNVGTTMDFPPFLPDPSIRMSMPTSQQIPIFTPLMCDPIVHVPVIDVCSSGQGYLVSAGPAMSTSIPPLHPRLVKPLISESDAVVKSARETLRLLISGSSQGNQHVTMDPLPAILTNPNVKQNNIFAAGSHGLYTVTRDIDVIANSIAAMGLASLSGMSRGEGDSKPCSYYGMSDSEVRKPSDSSSSCFDDKGDPPLDSTQ
ncbi:hypothetical protein Lalb_Chr04g0250791 [Lupinus albus]|uniref:Uncharacterized protein n=1 Tax=Lupinus albus TaxID=3870 RepID=A0A6A4QQ03_LUPAL|nr:hypothetical protein Lalb_Chr04g0250791 [Lupinus albus]